MIWPKLCCSDSKQGSILFVPYSLMNKMDLPGEKGGS